MTPIILIFSQIFLPKQPFCQHRRYATLQPVKINALRKSRAPIGCCHIRKTPPAVHVIVRRFIPLVITMVIHTLWLDTFWLVTCQVVSKIWIQLHWEWLACRNNHRLKGYPFAKIVPNKLTKTQCLLRFLLEIWDCKSFVQYYLILSEILSVTKKTGKWFCKNVADWCGDLVPEISERSKTWIDIAGPSDCQATSTVPLVVVVVTDTVTPFYQRQGVANIPWVRDCATISLNILCLPTSTLSCYQGSALVTTFCLWCWIFFTFRHRFFVSICVTFKERYYILSAYEAI
jgi:hypothetical protein